VLLRLAVVLHRGRTTQPLPHVDLRAADNEIRLEFPDKWLGANPLTRLDLKQEAQYLKAVGLDLRVAP
jgi:exopolyphosphatase/guanosine-5'-triphosphate,3'-diphosphate pyrophosphatase